MTWEEQNEMLQRQREAKLERELEDLAERDRRALVSFPKPIPVSERLPAGRNAVLVFVPQGQGWVVGDHTLDSDGNLYFYDTIRGDVLWATHWLPLPEDPT